MGIDELNWAKEEEITTVDYPVEKMVQIVTRAIIYNQLSIQKVLDVDINIETTA